MKGYRKIQSDLEERRLIQTAVDGYRWIWKDIEAQIFGPEKISDEIDVFPDLFEYFYGGDKKGTKK